MTSACPDGEKRSTSFARTWRSCWKTTTAFLGTIAKGVVANREIVRRGVWWDRWFAVRVCFTHGCQIY